MAELPKITLKKIKKFTSGELLSETEEKQEGFLF